MSSERPVFQSARPTTQRRFQALLLAVSALFGRRSEEAHKVIRQGYRSGKHNGRTHGAFGGKNKARYLKEVAS